ncbi:MAG: hypothetical protein Kow0063_34000 [Anaerolineae bacterium]
MEQIIYLEPDDDIPIIRDRMEWAQTQRVLLVVPPKNRELRSLVNLKLLRRHARNESLKVALVTRDPKIIELSREAGLVTFGSVEAAQRSRWLSEDGTEAEVQAYQRPTAEVHGELEASLDLPERPLKDVRRPRNLPRFRPPSEAGVPRELLALGFLLLSLMVAAMLAAVVVLIYPEGQVQIAPANQSITAELIVHADPQAERIDYTTLSIPARLVQVEIREVGRIPPATTQDMPANKSQGTVTFVNRTNQEITIPVSTTLSTSSGTTVRFQTVQTATIPAAFNAITQTGVIAVDPGPIGNVAAGQINRILDPVLDRQVTVINEGATSGGTMAPAGVVSRADKDRLQAIVLQQIQQTGYSQLLEGLAEQEFIPPESLIVIPLDAVYTPSLDGEVTDLLTLEMRAVVRGTAIAGQNANQLALAALQAQVPADYHLDPLSLEFVAGRVVEVRDRAVSFEMRAAATAVAEIDARQVARTVRGLPIEEAQRELRQRLALSRDPDIMVEPNWLGRLPWFASRINVDVVE